MATKAGVGYSNHRNLEAAVWQAVEAARERGGIDRPDFALLFSTVGYKQADLVRQMRRVLGDVPLVGCSGEGVVAQDITDEGNFALVVTLIQSDDLTFTVAKAEGLREDYRAAGHRIGTALHPALRDDSIALLLFADGISFNFDRFLAGLEEGIDAGRTLPVFGGAAGDNWTLEKTHQYCNDEVFSEGAVCVLLSGPARMVSAVNHGCVPIGGERTVTRAEGNVIHEIDGRPVFQVFKEYLRDHEVDNWTHAIANLALGFKAPSCLEGYNDYLIRFMPSRDEASGSVTVSTEVETGSAIWMTRRDLDLMSDGVDQVARDLRGRLDGRTPALVFQFDCAGRGKVIVREQQRGEMQRRLHAGLGLGDVPWVGFYTYGEIGPVNGVNCFHNYTLVLAALF